MKNYTFKILICFLLFGCKDNDTKHVGKNSEQQHNDEVHLTEKQVRYLDLRVISLKERFSSHYISANGRLAIAPNFEAVLHSFVSANVKKIFVIEGQRVTKNQVLAWVEHINIIALQREFIDFYENYLLSDLEYKRHKNLFAQKVISKKDMQQMQRDYAVAKANYSAALETLKLLNLDFRKIKRGKIFPYAPIKATISGYVEKIWVKKGQAVDSNTPLLGITNPEKIHVGLWIYQKDIAEIKQGQKVEVFIPAFEGKSFQARLFSVGKNFEADTKALHVHAEFENPPKALLEGMYVHAKIFTDNRKSLALEEDGFVQMGHKDFVFIATKAKDSWTFEPQEVIVDKTQKEVQPFVFKDFQPTATTKIVSKNAYYLLAELKKENTAHTH